MPLPLLNWQDLTEAERLQQDRERLLKRIQSLRPHAHKRIVLEGRYVRITARLIALEISLYGRK